MKSTAASSLLALLWHMSGAMAGYNWDILDHGLVEDFPWTGPFPSDMSELIGFDVLCHAKSKFKGQQYKFADLHRPLPDGLGPWGDAIERLGRSRAYPGSWDGTNLKGQDRDIIMMEYSDIPNAVREWIEAELRSEVGSHKRFMGIFPKPQKGNTGAPSSAVEQPDTQDVLSLPARDKVLLIAPGEIYHFLPLWVADGHKCEADYKDLTQYQPVAKEECIIAWPIEHPHGMPDELRPKRDIEFTIMAQKVRETAEGKASRLFWERANREYRRQARRNEKKERQENRKPVEQMREIYKGSPGTHDEL